MRRLLPGFRTRDLASDLLIVFLLAFGLGWAALLFTALDRLLLHPLDAPAADRLVRAGERHATVTSWAWFPFTAYQKMQPMRSFEQLAVEGDVPTTLQTGSGVAVPAAGAMVSGDYFSMLGGQAALGRVLTRADESAGSAIPIVLSHRFWQLEFGGTASVLGAPVTLQGKRFTVVGVMPAHFFGTRLDASPDFWLPLSAQALLSNKSLTSIDADRSFSIIGRLRDDVTAEQAQAEFAGIYRTIRGGEGKTGHGLILPIAEGSFALREQFGHALQLMLLGLTALLAMICASISGMLLARAVRRERETAVRLALGASRPGLIG